MNLFNVYTYFLSFVLSLTISSGFQNYASAIPLVKGKSVTLNSEQIDFLVNHTSANYNFEGIVALNNCSGALVRFKHNTANDAAMVLTNGHCVSNPDGGFIRPGEHVFNRAASVDQRKFLFLKADATRHAQSVKATKLIYATMTKTDLALYELEMTYAAILQKYKVNPLTLQEVQASAGESIQILSGYWNRGYECKIEQTVSTLREDAYTWKDSVRYTKVGCQTIHGTSGSPIISKATGLVIAINNTGNDDGQQCTMNNPCEVGSNGSIFVEKGRSYGQQIFWLYSCLNSSGIVDVQSPNCMLPGGAQAAR